MGLQKNRIGVCRISLASKVRFFKVMLDDGVFIYDELTPSKN